MIDFAFKTTKKIIEYKKNVSDGMVWTYMFIIVDHMVYAYHMQTHNLFDNVTGQLLHTYEQ